MGKFPPVPPNGHHMRGVLLWAWMLFGWHPGFLAAGYWALQPRSRMPIPMFGLLPALTWVAGLLVIWVVLW